MIRLSLLGAALVAITVAVHGVGSTAWLRVLGQRFAHQDGSIRKGKIPQAVVGTVLVLLALHVVEIIVWAVAFMLLLPPGELATLEEAVYFSFVTFTTLGYGDVTLTESWRLLSGIEALNGIMLVGWTTAMIFAVVQRAWHRLADNLRTGAADDNKQQ